MTKKCTKCGIEKDIEEFHKTSRKYEGQTYYYRHAKCKACRNAEKTIYNFHNREVINRKNKERYQKNYEKYSAKDRERYRKRIDK